MRVHTLHTEFCLYILNSTVEISLKGKWTFQEEEITGRNISVEIPTYWTRSSSLQMLPTTVNMSLSSCFFPLVNYSFFRVEAKICSSVQFPRSRAETRILLHVIYWRGPLRKREWGKHDRAGCTAKQLLWSQQGTSWRQSWGRWVVPTRSLLLHIVAKETWALGNVYWDEEEEVFHPVLRDRLFALNPRVSFP